MATKVKKLTKEELEKLQLTVNKLTRSKQTLGEMEYQKNQMISSIVGLEAEVKVVQQELEEKYGQVTIDLNTGEYQETAEAAE